LPVWPHRGPWPGRGNSGAPPGLFGPRQGATMIDDEKLRALPRDAPNYHERQAAHLRALAQTATAPRVKSRLVRKAEQHEDLARGGPAAREG
jgi:hypothetical protein